MSDDVGAPRDNQKFIAEINNLLMFVNYIRRWRKIPIIHYYTYPVIYFRLHLNDTSIYDLANSEFFFLKLIKALTLMATFADPFESNLFDACK